MRTIEIELYKFEELSETAQQEAIRNYATNDDSSFYYDDISGTIKAFTELFNIKLGREYTDFRTGHIEDSILQLKGHRLYAYIMNNYGRKLFKPSYIKIIEGVKIYKPFICEVNTRRDGSHYTILKSRNKVSNDCTLTGVCYDMGILGPVYTFLKKCEQNTTFEDLINDMGAAAAKCYQDTEDFLNSEEYIIDTITANEYEFTVEGVRA